MVSLTNCDQSIQWMVGDWKGAADHMASHSVEFWPQGGVCVSFIWFWHYFSTIYKYWLNVIQIEGIHLRAHQRVCVFFPLYSVFWMALVCCFECTHRTQQPVIVLLLTIYWKHVRSFTWTNIKYSLQFSWKPCKRFYVYEEEETEKGRLVCVWRKMRTNAAL